MRVELSDGQWIELRDWITRGQQRRIQTARARGLDPSDEALAVFTVAASLKGIELPAPGPEGLPAGALDAMNADDFLTAVSKALDIVNPPEDESPKDTASPSPDSPPAPASQLKAI